MGRRRKYSDMDAETERKVLLVSCFLSVDSWHGFE
jgi:hypothetical protein